MAADWDDGSMPDFLRAPTTAREQSERPSKQAASECPPPDTAAFWIYIDKAVLGLFELLALLFGLPFGDDLYHDKPVIGLHLAYLCIGVLFAIGGPMFPLIRKISWVPKWIAPSISGAARDARIWIAILIIFFLYGIGPELYWRATTPLSARISQLQAELESANRQIRRLEASVHNAPPSLLLESRFSQKTAQQLADMCKGLSPMQCDDVLQSEKDKLLAVAGAIHAPGPTSDGQMFIDVDPSLQVHCRFDPNKWANRLRASRVGELINVIGKIVPSSNTSSLLRLAECELQ